MVRKLGDRLANAASKVEEVVSVYDEIALELARSEREALDRVRKRITAQQLGEAFADIFSAAYKPKLVEDAVAENAHRVRA